MFRNWSCRLILQGTVLVVLVLLIQSAVPLRSQGGELLDYLPTIQVAKGMWAWQLTIRELELTGNVDPCPESINEQLIPDSLWVKNDGSIRTVEEATAVLIQVSCVMFRKIANYADSRANILQMEQPDSPRPFNEIVTEELAYIVLEVTSGKTVDLLPELSIDGTKQPYRLVAMYLLIAALNDELVGASKSNLLLDGRFPCESLDSMVRQGATVETQFAAFWTRVMDRFNHNVCRNSRESLSEAELESLLRSGDIDSAAVLSVRWASDFLLNNELIGFLSEVTGESRQAIRQAVVEKGHPSRAVEVIRDDLQLINEDSVSREYLTIVRETIMARINELMIDVLAHWGDPIYTTAAAFSLELLFLYDWVINYLFTSLYMS